MHHILNPFGQQTPNPPPAPSAGFAFDWPLLTQEDTAIGGLEEKGALGHTGSLHLP